ncbi:MAG: hypothetical protein ACRDZQ_09495, partial [Acidimicrobiales bacterium]
DRFARARLVADAVLYEGYVLYPYRASAQKNQARWQFGVLAPRPYSQAEGSDPWSMRTECVLEGGPGAEVTVRVRFLQIQARVVEEPEPGGDGYRLVPSLEVAGKLWTTWDEALEHEVDVGPFPLGGLFDGPAAASFELEGGRDAEVLADATGTPAARLVRERWPVSARLVVGASRPEGPYPLARVTVEVENVTDWAGPAAGRDEVVRHSLVAVHTLLAATGGRFVSLLDPPEFAADAVAGCANVGCFPVLAGDGGDDVVLSSPIILYDHPEVAPESGGDMFDATEIDEILALRVLTLTEEEKREARGTDARAAAIIDRCDTMAPEIFDRLHGAIRSLRPVRPAAEEAEQAPWWDPESDASVDPLRDTVSVGGVAVGAGTRVRLCPSRRADAQDVFLAGHAATVAGVFNDVDGGVHLAVVLEDDPAAEMHEWYGRYRYFRPDEVDVLEGS